jgi:FkbM family methyltransferase
LGLKDRPQPELSRPFFWNEISFAQIQQDRWVLSETSNKRDGFFVEIGAFDGKNLSNSYLLEKDFGWRGILAEPNPTLSETIRKTRTSPLCTQPVDAVSGRSITMRFVDHAPEYSAMADRAFSDDHADLRRKSGTEVVQTTISLNDLLAQHSTPGHIDFMSIDTEGNELDILSTLDVSRYHIHLMCIEHNFTGANAQMDALMFDRGYERVHREWSRFDAWYRKK